MDRQANTKSIQSPAKTQQSSPDLIVEVALFMHRKWGLRLTLGGVLALAVSAMLLFTQQATAADSPPWIVKKRGVELDIRSEGRMRRDRFVTSGILMPNSQQSGNAALPDLGFGPQTPIPQGNIQVSDDSLDQVLRVPGVAPLVLYTQDEPAFAVYGRNIVATYNTSVFATDFNPDIQFFDTLFGTGFSTSRDRGRTWTSGFLPPVRNSSYTFGDATVTIDRQGNFYATSLGLDADFTGTVQINKATHGGIGWPSNWSDAVIVALDNGSDKPWMAVGPDPVRKQRDNVYVTWTSFQSFSQPDATIELRFGRSIDGGATWSTQTIFTPEKNPKNPAGPQNRLQYSVPFVDASTGRLYIPFLHFGGESGEDAYADFIRILISDDGGQTFPSFATFKVPGAPNNDPTLLPIVSPGTLTDCGSNSRFRLTIHAGPDVGGGQNGLPRFVRASRLITQPAFAARNGLLYLAWSNSRSGVFGDGNGSDILFMWSNNGGKNWKGPIQVNPTVSNDIHHVLPTLAINEDPSDRRPTLYISYYTQHRDETVDVDTASADQDDDAFTFTAVRVTSTPSALAPTNIPLPTADDPFNTVNFDYPSVSCANLGEYMSARVANGISYVMWTDSRHMFTEPRSRLNPLSGQTHPQQDIFFESMPVQ